MEDKKIKKTIEKLKAIIARNISEKKYDRALKNISACASILYSVNYTFIDEDLENALIEIASLFEVKSKETYSNSEIIFYDGFGLNDRGLAQIYLKALTKCYRVIYITEEKNKMNIPDILDIVKVNGEAVYLREKRLYDRIEELKNIINIYTAKKFIFYSYPQDVVGVTCMNIYDGILDRYNINLTDHAFWLGAKAIDYNVEFRNYGASISRAYRKIEDSKIIMLPYYPNINQNVEFQGLPFNANGKKIIFSGGSLYKTYGDDNKYYYMVERILQENESAIFWYAGSGDASELNKLKDKYKDRVFYTSERKDLYQVLKHCDLYLSTYPICGGLMFQYAAVANKVPITLKYDDISNDFLLNQAELNVEFDDLEALLKEVKKMLSDEGYMEDRCAQIGNAVITMEEFETRVENVFLKNIGDEIIYDNDIKIDIKSEYVKNYTVKKLCSDITSQWTRDIVLRFPKESFIEFMLRIKRKVKRLIKR